MRVATAAAMAAGGAVAVATVDTDVTAEMAEILGRRRERRVGRARRLRRGWLDRLRRGKGRLAFIRRFVRQKLAAVKGVSLSFRSGNVFALLGHNGAGKTTTFSMIAAQLEPSHGDVIKRVVRVRRADGAAPPRHLPAARHPLPRSDRGGAPGLYGRLTGTASTSASGACRAAPQVRLHTPGSRSARLAVRRRDAAAAFRRVRHRQPGGSSRGDRKVVISTSRRRGWTR